MLWNDTPLKTTFLLGAGATRGAFDHVLVNRKRIRAPLNSDFFKVAETLCKAFQRGGDLGARFKRVRKVFADEFSTRGSWPIPMEDAFSLLYVSKDFPEIYAPRRGPHREAGSRREIEDFLRLTFEILAVIESKGTPLNLYARLAARLDPLDTLITLNYDTMLDSALVEAGWNPRDGYGLTGGQSKVKWRRSRIAAEPRLKGVKLLKLHGSINWYVRGSYDKLARVFDAKATHVLITARPRTNETHGYIRQVVPPIYGKFFGHPQWGRLWTAAHQHIRDADVIVIIGCSLVDSDFHLRGMLSHAIAQRKRQGNPFRAVALVDITRVRNKWRRLFRGSTNKFYGYKTFSKFARECL